MRPIELVINTDARTVSSCQLGESIFIVPVVYIFNLENDGSQKRRVGFLYYEPYIMPLELKTPNR